MSISVTLIDNLPTLILVAALLRGAGARNSTTTITTAGRDITTNNETSTVTAKIGATQARDLDVK